MEVESIVSPEHGADYGACRTASEHGTDDGVKTEVGSRSGRRLSQGNCDPASLGHPFPRLRYPSARRCAIDGTSHSFANANCLPEKKTRSEIKMSLKLKRKIRSNEWTSPDRCTFCTVVS